MWIGLADEEGRSWYGISSEVDIDPSTNDFISGVFRLITPDESRLTNKEIAAAVIDFCGNVDEFWAWIPTMERFAEWFGLGEEAAGLYAKHWDVDLQMVRSLVQPWPDGWPDRLLDLNAAAVEAGVEVPPRAVEPARLGRSHKERLMELRIENLSKQYRQDAWGLRDFSSRVGPGVLGLLGPKRVKLSGSATCWSCWL
jgi:hypothetical protein